MVFRRNTRVSGNTVGKMSSWDSFATPWTPLELKTAPSPPTVLAPKDFYDNNIWVPVDYNINVLNNTQVNPVDATADVDELRSNGNTSFKYLIQSGLSFVEGFEYTFSIYVKAGATLTAGKHFQVSFGTTCFDQDFVNVDITTPSTTPVAAPTTPSGLVTITDAGGGWLKVDYSLVAKATGTDDVAIGFAGGSYRGGVFVTSNQTLWLYNAVITCRSTLKRWYDPSDSSTLVLSGSNVSTFTDKIVGEVLTPGVSPHILVANASGTASALQSVATTAASSLTAANSNVFRNKAVGTIFWMGLIGSGTLAANASPVFASRGDANNSTRLAYCVSPTGGANQHGAGVRRLDADGYATLVSSQTTDRDVVFIGQSTMSWQSNLGSVYYNGVEVLAPTAPSPALTAGYTSDTDSLAFGIPGVNLAPTVGSQWFDVLAFDSGLPSTIRQKLEGWLAHKASQSALLDVSHPYKTQAPYLS